MMPMQWITILATMAERWGIPEEVRTTLIAYHSAAKKALDAAMAEDTRTKVATEECRAAFGLLKAFMRDVKRRYFLVPPLTEADLISLGLVPHVSHRTPTGIPEAQVMVETFLIGARELGIDLVYISGDPKDPANKGYRVYYSVVGHDETPPGEPKELRESFFKTLKREEETLDGKHPAWKVRSSAFMYVESYYNRVRLHSALDYVAPDAFNCGRAA